MRPLGEVQLSVLEAMAEHNGWHPGCGWLWSTVSATIRISDTLVQRQLLTKVPYGRVFRYDLTDAGKRHVPDGFTKRRMFQREHEALFGSKDIERKVAIRAKLIVGGTSPHDPDLHVKVEEAYWNRPQDEPADQPARPAQKAPQPLSIPPLCLGLEELERLVDRFTGASDPISVSIHDKALAILAESSH